MGMASGWVKTPTQRATRGLRDLLIMRHVLDWREARKPESGDQLDGPGTAS